MKYLKSYRLFENGETSIKEELADILIGLTDRGIEWKLKTPENQLWIIITGRTRKNGLLTWQDIKWSDVSADIEHAKSYLASCGWEFIQIDGMEVKDSWLEGVDKVETELSNIPDDSIWSSMIVQFSESVNEGFWDYFKKREPQQVSLDDIRDCFVELGDNDKIKTDRNGKLSDGIFTNPFDNSKYELVDEFLVCGNELIFRIQWSPEEISDLEVNALLEEAKSRLKSFDCLMTFYISWGMTEGRTGDREWSDLIKGLDKTIRKGFIDRNITVKIKTKGLIHHGGLKQRVW